MKTNEELADELSKLILDCFNEREAKGMALCPKCGEHEDEDDCEDDYRPMEDGSSDGPKIWIDTKDGDDAGTGSAVNPIKTFAELRRRLASRRGA